MECRFDGGTGEERFVTRSTTMLKWRKLPVDSPVMKNHTATAFRDSLYIFGGFDGSTNSNQMKKFNVDTAEWTTVDRDVNGVPPQGRNGHSATLVPQDKIYFIGGWLGVGPLGAADVHVFDLGMFTWSKAETFGALPGPCNMHTANYLACKHAIFLFRGGNGQNYLNDLHVLDLISHTWTLPITVGKKPPIRANHSSATWESNLYIFGGWNGVDRLNDLYVLDTQSMTWREIDCFGIPPTPRAGSTLTCVFERDPVEDDPHLLLFGGSGAQNTCFNDLHMFQISTCTWTKVPCTPAHHQQQQPQRIIAHSASNPNVSANEMLSNQPPPPSALHHLLSSYTQSEDAPEKRAGHTATLVCGGRKLVVIGGSFGPEYRRTVFELDLDPTPDFSLLCVPLAEREHAFVLQLGNQFNQQEFADVCFLLETNRRLYAHRVVLAPRNEYFCVLFSHGFRESKQTEIPINNVTYETFYELVRFLYTGHVDFSSMRGKSSTSVQQLYVVADQFMCPELKSICEMELSKLVCYGNLNQIYQFAFNHGAHTLARYCLHCEKWGCGE